MKTKKISILASGDEILTGRLVDTNSAWISKFVQNLGYEITYIGIAGDNTETLKKLILFASKQSDIIIITGGLGPTEDDKTRFVLAKITKQKLIFNFVANHTMFSFYKKLGRDFSSIPSSNYIQCMIPTNSFYIPNLNGTACGIVSNFNDTQIIALPGVPHEMKSMMEYLATNNSSFLPRVGKPYIIKVMTLFGLSESRLGEMIKAFMIKKEPIVGITAKTGFLQISVMGFSESPIMETFLKIELIVSEYLISKEGKTPPEILIDLCRQQNYSIGTIESCTGGLIADAIISIPGSSDVFQSGVLSYTNGAKMKFANVSSQTLEKSGAVSEEVVSEMAKGYALNNQLNICLASSGVAGPGGGTIEKPIGTVCLGLYLMGETITYTIKFGGNRQEIRMRSAIHSICLAIQQINKKIIK
jgi:nicotinamide-nucleotide amidase